MTDINRPAERTDGSLFGAPIAAPVAAPCGSWRSAVSAALVAGRTIGLSTLRADGADLLWLEGRPAEAGRTVLRRQRESGPAEDLTPSPFDVGSRVHEYGGGAYAASGGRICFSHRPDGSLWLIEPGRGNEPQPPRPVCTVPGLRFADLCFGPGGADLIAVREDGRGGGTPEAAIIALPLEDGPDPSVNEGTILVRGPDFLSSPRVSPDGRRLAWIAWNDPDMPWDATRLHGAALCAGAPGRTSLADPRCLAGGAENEALMQPLFDAQGVLHVCSDRNGWWNLYRLSSEGALVPVCPMQREIGLPPWVFGQRSFDFLPDGSILANAIEGGRAQVLHIVDGAARPMPIGPAAECPVVLARKGGVHLGWLRAAPDAAAAVVVAPFDRNDPARVVVSSHSLALLPDEIAAAEPIRFPTQDGAVGHAFHYAPANARFGVPQGETPPLVVMAHGGPTGMTSDALSLRVQWWTSRGIGVVDVNYGGSTGFGRAYRKRLDGQWGVVDVDDCIAACRHLVETGRADPARIAIRGSSAGGFTVLAALTRSTLFSAAACLYGIGELRSLAAETHKFEARYLDRLVGRLPEDAAIYDARSPIHHLDALRCPVIFFHGLDDKVVPVAQTRLMAQAMQQRGIRAEVHEFAGEAHGFRREETIRQVLELELAFYGSLWGFTPADPLEE